MSRTILPALAALFAVTVGAQEEPAAPPRECVDAREACMERCDDRKLLWLFKGEAYETCAADCEEEFQACAQGPDEAFEVIRRRPEVRDNQPMKERVQEQLHEDEPPEEPPPGMDKDNGPGSDDG